MQHPNICTVYEIDEVDGSTFIAMAYLEGEELTKRIEKGPLSVERLASRTYTNRSFRSDRTCRGYTSAI